LNFYLQCVSNCDDPVAAITVVQSLPELNRLVLCYFIHFLQVRNTSTETLRNTPMICPYNTVCTFFLCFHLQEKNQVNWNLIKLEIK